MQIESDSEPRPAGPSPRGRACRKTPARVPDQATTADVILCQKYRQLARSHLEHLPTLFNQLTGLQCCISWAPSGSHQWSERDLPMRSRFCRRLVAGNAEAGVRCLGCAAQNLARTLKSGHLGHRFTCFLGIHNYWLPIVVRRCTVGLAFVQALDHTAARVFVRQQPNRSRRASASGRAMPAPRQPCPGTKGISRLDFNRAVRFSQLIFEHVVTSTLADLRKSDLAQAQQALRELQTVATRQREELNGLMPAFNRAAPALQPENHAERIVHAAMDYVHRHYAQPMTLQGCADALRLNAAYLSTLFARTVGLSFKTYLTDVRLEKARLLLNDLTRNISEVAGAVGYASENCFRLAFKKVTGLSPRSWRETFVAVRLFFLGWLLDAPDCIESVGGLLL